jgi:protein-L-isoaspartate(D-aspartate) O-methyltransferase
MDFTAARRTMVATQIRTGAITDPLVIAAIEEVPRELFVPEARRTIAYVDEDLPLGKGRFLMEPLVLARLLQLADVQSTDRALVIGAGTGYAAAVLGRMVASVVALENDHELTGVAARALPGTNAVNVRVVNGDLTAGYPSGGPYDVILIAGAVNDIPAALKQQMADNGRLVTVLRDGPVGRGVIVERVGNSFGLRDSFDAVTPVLPGFEKQLGFVF